MKSTKPIVFFASILTTMSLNAQNFSIQKLLEIRQNQKLFEAEMIKNGMTLVGVEEWTNNCYIVHGEPNNLQFVPFENKDKTDDRIPTNDISNKNNDDYYYVGEKIELILKFKYRVVTFAYNYDHNKETATSWFRHRSEYLEEQIPNYPKYNFSKTPVLEIECNVDLFKYFLDQISFNLEYSRSGKYSDAGIFYEYFEKSTNQNKTRAFIVSYNDDSWGTIRFD